jgi:type I restriction enzyme S subunit
MHFKVVQVSGSSNATASWPDVRLGSLLTPRSSRGGQHLPLLSVVRERGVILRDVASKEANHNFIPDDLSNYKVVDAGQLVINKMKAWSGSLGIAGQAGIVSPAYFVYDVAFENKRYAHLLFRSRTFVDEFARCSGGVRVGQWDLNIPAMKGIRVRVPSVEEQGLIVRYLDHAELRIAKAIAAKQKMVLLMDEQRSAVVAHEMLGGENKRTSMKQLEGFGEIPAHWEVMTLRGLLRKIALRNPGGNQLLSVLRSRGVIERSLDRADNHNFIPDDLSNYKVVKPGDLVMNKMKAWSGSVGVSQHHGVVSPAYFVYEFRSSIDPAFMNLLFRSNYMRYWFGRYSEGVRVGQWDLSPEEIKNIRVPVPALEEQIAISERVVARTAEMDAAIASVQAEIALLKEYRTRLISDVVTGKLDIREEAAKLPEIDPMELATVSVGENGDDEEATDDD